MNNLFNQFLNLIILLSAFILIIVCSFLMKDLFQINLNSSDTLAKNVSKNKQDLKTKMFKDADRIENGIHVKTGLAWDKDFDIVRSNCTSCHSAKLITQNRATKEGWEEMIVWMQKTQGLHDLGDNHEVIVSYLSKYYAPKSKGRRPGLKYAEIDWYELE